jgi:hypothetical protein
MSHWTTPFVVFLVALPISAIFVALLNRLPDRDAVGLMDKFAREVDLAITPDVEPGLRRFFGKSNRIPWYAVPILALVAGGYAAIDELNLGEQLILGSLILNMVANLWLPMRRKSPEWGQWGGVRHALARHTELRDYVHPVVLRTTAVASSWTVTLSVVLALFSHTPHDRWLAVASLAVVLGGEGAMIAVAHILLRHSRRQAETVQQLAFDDALLGKALSNLVSGTALILGWLSFLFLPHISSAPGWAAAAAVILWALAAFGRPAGSARYYRSRLYPDAPQAPLPAPTTTIGIWAQQISASVKSYLPRGGSDHGTQGA